MLVKVNLVEMNDHIIVDTITGLTAGASQSGLARILGIDESTVRFYINNCAEINPTRIDVHTSTGIRSVKMVPFSNFHQIIKYLKPKLLEASAEYGLNSFFLQRAGYEAPKLLENLSQADRIKILSKEAQEYCQLKECLIVLPGQININKQVMDASIMELPPQEEWVTTREFLDKFDIKLDQCHFWNFSRNCSNIFRTIYHDNPPKSKNGRFMFPVTLKPYFTEWLAQVV
jgi:hypothetical protein